MLNQDIVSGNFITGSVVHDVLKCCQWKQNYVCDLSFVGDNVFRDTETKRHRLITISYMFLQTVDNHIPWKALRCPPSASAVFESTCKNMACEVSHPAHLAKRDS